MSDNNAAVLQLVAQALANSWLVAVPPPPVYNRSNGSYLIQSRRFHHFWKMHGIHLWTKVAELGSLVLQGFIWGETRKALSALGASASDYDDFKLWIGDCCWAAMGTAPTPQEEFIWAS